MTSNSRIKNLKENMDYLVDIINQLQEKQIPITSINTKKRKPKKQKLQSYIFFKNTWMNVEVA